MDQGSFPTIRRSNEEQITWFSNILVRSLFAFMKSGWARDEAGVFTRALFKRSSEQSFYDNLECCALFHDIGSVLIHNHMKQPVQSVAKTFKNKDKNFRPMQNHTMKCPSISASSVGVDALVGNFEQFFLASFEREQERLNKQCFSYISVECGVIVKRVFSIVSSILNLIENPHLLDPNEWCIKTNYQQWNPT